MSSSDLVVSAEGNTLIPDARQQRRSLHKKRSELPTMKDLPREKEADRAADQPKEVLDPGKQFEEQKRAFPPEEEKKPANEIVLSLRPPDGGVPFDEGSFNNEAFDYLVNHQLHLGQSVSSSEKPGEPLLGESEETPRMDITEKMVVTEQLKNVTVKSKHERGVEA